MKRRASSRDKQPVGHWIRGHCAVDAYVGKRIRLRRLLLGLDQPTFAKRLGVGFQQVQRYETGRDSARASRLAKIAQVLEVPVSYFFKGLQGEEGREMFKNETTKLMEEPETIELIRFYLGISNITTKRLVFDLMKAIAAQAETS
jgi:transcriptional regulator with XRE-family HTH domain